MSLTVVKVGGSLYDLPDLGSRLRCWLATLDTHQLLLVPGGGITTDVVRELDGVHRLGEEVAHALALRTLTLNAWFLAALLGGDPPVLAPRPGDRWGGVALLDAWGFCATDRGPERLPASWEATSDSVAARAAVVLGAGELYLLKSVEVEDWQDAAARGAIDPVFPSVLRPGLRVRAVNLRRQN
jgi:aspartokinase-like uncharacterized kinase